MMLGSCDPSLVSVEQAAFHSLLLRGMVVVVLGKAGGGGVRESCPSTDRGTEASPWLFRGLLGKHTHAKHKTQYNSIQDT
jgi:hypothetical protein